MAAKAAGYIDCTLRVVVIDGDDESDDGYSYHPNSEMASTYHDLRKNKHQ